MINILGKEYYIDLNKLLSFIDKNSNGEVPTTQTITATYNDDLSMLSKEIVEAKVNINETLQTAKFDIMRIFLDTLITTTYDSNGELITGVEEEPLSLGQRMSFNTLIKAGILIEK